MTREEELAELTREVGNRGGLAPPHRLYRFLAPTGKFGLHNIRALLERNEVYLASRRDFNDPFDSEADLAFSGDVELMAAQIDLISRTQQVGPARARRRVRQSGATPESVRAAFSESLKRHIDLVGITSFCKHGGSPTQWSHYADQHRGLAVEVRFRSHRLEIPALPVAYRSRRPRATYPGKTWGPVIQAVLTKHSDWKYEGEWRLMEIGKAGTTFVLPSSSLSRVILGYRAPEELHEEVQRCLAVRKAAGLPAMRLARARRADGRYRIEFD